MGSRDEAEVSGASAQSHVLPSVCRLVVLIRWPWRWFIVYRLSSSEYKFNRACIVIRPKDCVIAPSDTQKNSTNKLRLL